MGLALETGAAGTGRRRWGGGYQDAAAFTSLTEDGLRVPSTVTLCQSVVLEQRSVLRKLSFILLAVTRPASPTQWPVGPSPGRHLQTSGLLWCCRSARKEATSLKNNNKQNAKTRPILLGGYF